MSLLERDYPFNQVDPDDPLCRRELAHIEQMRESASYRQMPFGLQPIHLLAVAGIAFFAIMTVGGMRPAMGLIDLVSRILPGVPVVAFSLSLAVDLYSVYITVSTWRTRRESPMWDLVRLTPPGEERITTAYFALTQIRAWRGVQLDSGARRLIGLALLLPFGFGLWFSACMLPGYFGLYNYHGYYTPPRFSVFSAAVAILIVAGAMVLVYVREPLWRVRSVLAACLMLSTRLRDHSTALFTCVAMVLGVRLIQLAAVVVLLLSCLVALEQAWIPPDGAPLRPFTGTLGLLLVAALMTTITRQCYRIAERLCLWQTVRLIRRGD